MIGIDTLENIESPLTQEEMNRMLAPLQQNFQTGSRQFVEKMISPATDALLRHWILSDIAAAPPSVALSAMKEMMQQYITGEAAKVFDQIQVPVITVNSNMWPSTMRQTGGICFLIPPLS